MREITLENAEVGLVLAGDLHDSNGRLILKKGTVLTESHLHTLKARRIATLSVDDLPDEKPKVEEKRVDPVLAKKVDLRLKQKFRNADVTHPFMKILYKSCEAKLIAQGSKTRKSNGS